MRQALLAVLLLVGSVAQARGARVRSVGEVERVEQALNAALNAGDVPQIATLWADTLLFTFPNGKRATKAERLRGIDPGASAVKSVVDNITVQLYGTTAVTSVLTTWTGAQGPGQQYRATHVWIRRGPTWRLVAAHVTQVAKPEPR
ncbi:MAG: nuclear transport factor 2 family protein [Acidobacteriota bacterium]|nr:nuclear transport factor 2 family protein [Acidobacteriota bacterium]